MWGFFIKDDSLNWSPVDRLQKCHKKKKDKFKIQHVKTREKKLKVVFKKRRRPGFSEHTGLFKYSQRSVIPRESQGAGTLSQRERERKWIKQLSCKLVPFFTSHFSHSFCLRVAPTPYHKVSTLLKRLLIHSYLRDGVKCVKGNVIFCNKKNNLTWSHPTTRWIHLNVHLRTLKLFLSISQHY